ncbi:MAG: hypothetical protein FWE90_04040 [Defluviitaleaceae bacterium]|nr:hypothetical protein [Defluviitaleaceae bacterium]
MSNYVKKEDFDNQPINETYKYQYTTRWDYYSEVVELLESFNDVGPILELGPSDLAISSTCDVMVKPLAILILPHNTSGKIIEHDATSTPWPIDNKEYDVFVSLQVWEHLGNAQVNAFKEVIRVSKRAILSFPYKWKCAPDNCHYMIDESKISEWTCGVQPAKKIIVPGNNSTKIIYYYEFDKHFQPEVVLSINENKLYCKIINHDYYNGLYSYELYHNNSIVMGSQIETNDKHMYYYINGYGNYQVEVKFNKLSDKIKSNYVYGYSNDIKNKYNIFTDDLSYNSIPKLKYAYNTYPFTEIAFVITKTDLSRKILRSEFSKLNGFNLKEIIQSGKRKLHIISSCIINNDLEENSFAFSGITKITDKLIIGQKDVAANVSNVRLLHDEIGDFSLFHFNKYGAEARTDYFGVSRIYHYEDDEFIIIINSYHLILLFLRLLDVRLKLNDRKVNATYHFSGNPILQHNISWHMEIFNVRQLQADYAIKISQQLIPEFVKTQLYDDLRTPLSFELNEYEKILFNAKNEIINNVKVALEHPAFEHIVLDLTGGLDSRTVFAALTTLPISLQKKVRIRTFADNSDLEISSIMVNMYDFDYEDFPTVRNIDWAVNFEEYRQSQFLGQYFASQHYEILSPVDSILLLGGRMGEVVDKCFYITKSTSFDEWKENTFNVTNGRNIVSNGINNVLYEGGQNDFQEEFKEYFMLAGGNTTAETYDQHFMYFYNSYHFGGTLYTMLYAPIFSPLMSKSCLKAKRMGFPHVKTFYDLIPMMNPLLAIVPFVDIEHNKRRERISELPYTRGYPNADIIPNTSRDKYKASQTKKYTNIKYEPSNEIVNDERKKSIHSYQSKEPIINMIRAILSSSHNVQHLGLSFFAWSQTLDDDVFKYNYQARTFIRKIISFYRTIEILDMKPDDARNALVKK